VGANLNSKTGQTKDGNLFCETQWSMVVRAQHDSVGALNCLCNIYRKPLIVYLRSVGINSHDAEDCVQGFFANLIKRDSLAHVSQLKGHFRTFLLTSLNNFRRDLHDHDVAKKRGSGIKPESLDETNVNGDPLLIAVSDSKSADQLYDKAWAETVLDNALKNVRDQCAQSGHHALMEAVEPVLFFDMTSMRYREIGERLGMSETAVKTAALRIRARLRLAVREEVLQTVTEEKELVDELRYLISLFGR